MGQLGWNRLGEIGIECLKVLHPRQAALALLTFHCQPLPSCCDQLRELSALPFVARMAKLPFVAKDIRFQ